MVKMPPQPSVTIWTWFVRATHWLVAISVLVNLMNESGSWHRSIGYAAVGLVLMRLCHGLWISREPASRFTLPRLSDIKVHLKVLISGKVSAHVGHNPLGQLAVYVMWGIILLLALTGWLSRTDQYWGEDWPVDIHSGLSNALLGMVMLHLPAVVLMSKLQGKNLIRAMLRGR